MNEIHKCECGSYLQEDELEYVMDFPQTLLEPEEGHCTCPNCGRDYEDMVELSIEEVLELLNE